MADDKSKDYELLRRLRDDSLKLVESEVKAARALRSVAVEKVAGDDFLYGLSRLHLGYYSDLLRLLSGQFDTMVEKLRALSPEPPPEPEVAESRVLARGAVGEALVSAPFTVVNAGGSSTPATFDCSEFRDRDGTTFYSDLRVEAETTDGDGGSLVPARGEREFAVTLHPQSEIRAGHYLGTVYVRLRGDLVQRVRVRLDVG